MVTIQAKGKIYGVKHFVVDTKDDFDLLRKDLLFMGSTAYVISTGETYIVDSKRNWVLKAKADPTIGGGSNEDSGNDDEDNTDTIIYDGGEIL